MFATSTRHRGDATPALSYWGGRRALGAGRCRSQLRALLLTFVWALPALWCVGHTLVHELEAVAKRVLYLSAIARTETAFEIAAIIEAFRGECETQKRRAIPL